MNTGDIVPNNKKTAVKTDDWDLTPAERDAYWHGGQIRVLQEQFANRLKALSDESKGMTQKEFETWENDFALNYNRLHDVAQNNAEDKDDYYLYMCHMVAYPGEHRESDLRKTIEAQAGNFFFERRGDLVRAIRTSDKSDQDKEKDLQKIRDFENNAYVHMDYAYRAKEEQNSYKLAYLDKSRKSAHDATIDSLNDINRLAEKYHTKRFTVRDFTKSAGDNERCSGRELSVIRYDRDIVEEYYKLAFPDHAEKMKKDLEDNMLYSASIQE